MLDLEKVDDVLDDAAMLHLLSSAGPWRQQLPEEAPFIFSARPAMMLSSVDMPLKMRRSGTFGRCRRSRPRRRSHAAALFALEGDAAIGRVIETVDAVQHRGLAGAIRADDRADFALADVERNIRERLDAAESERHILDRQQRPGVRDDAGRRALSCRRLQRRPPRHRVDVHVADIHPREMRPLRPSSNVTSVEMSASRVPS